MTTDHLLRTTVLAPEKDAEENDAIPVGRFVGQGPCREAELFEIVLICPASLERCGVMDSVET